MNNEDEIKEINQIKEYNKKMKSDYKEKIRAFNNEVLICDCGAEYTRMNNSKHYRSKQHYAYFLSQQLKNQF